MRNKAERMKPWALLLAFFLIPIAMITVCNQILIAPNEGAYYTFYELSKRNDVDLAIVGSSVVQSSFNTNLITEITGLESHNVSVGHMAMPGSLAAAKVMYKTNKPKYVCLVLEPDSFGNLSENRQTQQLLLPYTLDPAIGIPYYLELCSRDGMYFERLFVFRSFMAKSLDDVKRAIQMRMDPKRYYRESEFGQSGYYKGRGYISKGIEGTGEATLRFVSLRPTKDNAITAEISSYSKRKILEFRDLCEKHGSEMIVVMPPNMMAHALAKDGFAQKHVELENFCNEQNIPFFNFNFAKEAFMPRLDAYFADVLHMDYRAADVFSTKFAEILQMYIRGEEISQYFYHAAEEYLASIQTITNAWIEEEVGQMQTVYKADCLRGEAVIPEYSFYLVEDDGSHTLLQPYSEQNTFTCAAGELTGRRLRVYARPVGSEEESKIFYDIIVQGA